MIEETRAYQAMSAQELTGAIQQALVEANEARRIGTGNMHGLLSSKILMEISCALVGVTQLASRVPANEEVKALNRTMEGLIQMNEDLRTRLEKLENRRFQPGAGSQQPAADTQPQVVKEGSRKRTRSSPEEAIERKRGMVRGKRRTHRIVSSSSTTPEEMEIDEAPKPQRTVTEKPKPTRADFMKSREVPPTQEVAVFDDTAIRETEAQRKGKRSKKKKKNLGRGELELFSLTLPEIRPPVRIEFPLPLLATDRGQREELWCRRGWTSGGG